MSAPVFLLGPDPSNQCCGCETRSGPCDPCASCFYTSPVTLGSGPQPPFSSEADAQADIDHFVNGCLSHGVIDNGEYDAISVAMNAGTLEVSETQSSIVFTGIGDDLAFRISALIGALIVAFTLSGNQVCDNIGISATLYADDAITIVGSDSKQSSGVTSISGTLNIAVPASGFYYLRIILVVTRTSPSFPFIMTLNPCHVNAPSLQVCTVRAAYNTGGDDQYVNCSTI